MEKVSFDINYLKRDITILNELNKYLNEYLSSIEGYELDANSTDYNNYLDIKDRLKNFEMIMNDMKIVCDIYEVYDRAINEMLEQELKKYSQHNTDLYIDNYDYIMSIVRKRIESINKDKSSEIQNTKFILDIKSGIENIEYVFDIIVDIFNDMKKYWEGDVANYFYDVVEEELTF